MRDTPCVSLSNQHVVKACLVAARPSCCLFNRCPRCPSDRFRMGRRCRGSWCRRFHRGAGGQGHGSNRQQWSKDNKFFHSWNCSFQGQIEARASGRCIWNEDFTSQERKNFPSRALETRTVRQLIVQSRSQLLQFRSMPFFFQNPLFQSSRTRSALAPNFFTPTNLNLPFFFPFPFDQI